MSKFLISGRRKVGKPLTRDDSELNHESLALDYESSPDSSKNAKAKKAGKWTSEEDDLLRKFVLVLGENQWREISEKIPGRSSIECKDRWKIISQSGLIKGQWTAEEDQKLLKWVQTNGACKWVECANFIKGRSDIQCRQRWPSVNPEMKKGKWSKEEDKKMLTQRDKIGKKQTLMDNDDENHESNHESNTSDYELILGVSEDDEAQETGRWTRQEDDLLCQFVPVFGEKQWHKISENIPRHSFIQCRDHWKKILQPKLDKRHWTAVPWASEEDDLLCQFVLAFGENQWHKISENIPRRSFIQCRDRWRQILEPRLDQRHCIPVENQNEQASSQNDVKILIEIDNLDWEDTPLDDGDQNPKFNPEPSTSDHQPIPEVSGNTRASKTEEWTSEQDDLLCQYVPVFGENQWQQIIENIKGHSFIQCRDRWRIILESRSDIEHEKKQASTPNSKKMFIESDEIDEKEIVLCDADQNEESNHELYASDHKLSPGASENTKAQETGRWTYVEDQKLLKWVETNGACKWVECSNFINGRSSLECLQRWFNHLNPDVKNGKWSKEEDKLLLQLFDEYGPSWTKIAQFIPGRSSQECLEKWLYMNPDLREGKSSQEEEKKMLVERNKIDEKETPLDDSGDQNSESNHESDTPDYKLSSDASEDDETQETSEWTSEEDDLLRKFFHLLGENQWQEISENIPGRSSTQCKDRWTKILRSGPFQGRWTAEEHQKLLKWVEINGACKWAGCANFIKGRSQKQCRERWRVTLNPCLKKEKWSKEEEELLLQLFHEYGRSWSMIAKFLPGRSDKQCLIKWRSEEKKGNWRIKENKVDEKETPFDDDQNPESSPQPSTLDDQLFPEAPEGTGARKHGKWTRQEDDLLSKFVPAFGENQWRKISHNIPGRSSIQCLRRWTKLLKLGEEGRYHGKSKIPQKTERHKKNKQTSTLNEKEVLVERNKADEREFEEKVNTMMSDERMNINNNDTGFENLLIALDCSLKDDFLTKELDLNIGNIEDISYLEDSQIKVMSSCQSNITYLCEAFKKIKPDKASTTVSKVSQSEGRGNAQLEMGEKGSPANAFPDSPMGESETSREKIMKGNESRMEIEEAEDRVDVQRDLLGRPENSMVGLTDAEKRLSLLFRHLDSLETILSNTNKDLVHFESSLEASLSKINKDLMHFGTPMKGGKDVRPEDIKRDEKGDSEFDQVVKKRKVD